MDIAAAKMPAPLQPTAPHMVEGKAIGFDLPQEFQKRVSLAEGQSVYPPLNVATARKFELTRITYKFNLVIRKFVFEDFPKKRAKVVT